MITYGKTVFLTTTYSRTRLLDSCWKGANSNFNRYIQKLRRLHQNPIQYLRTIEMHADGYPHFHAILRFPTVLTITNGRYFDKALYAKWKSTWPYGLSDSQPPFCKQSPLAYIIKYTTKNSGRKIWLRFYQHSSANSVIPLPPHSSTTKKVTFSAEPVTRLSQNCAKYKIKQCTWSRKFFNSLINN